MTEESIRKELNSALKGGQKTIVSTLRMLISEINNRKIEEGVKELDEAKIIGVLQKLAKQHKESIEKFKLGNRDDLVEKEKEELDVLEKYLPEALSEEELEGIISDVIFNTGASSQKDMGLVMKQVLEKTAGRADGKIASRIVQEKLTK